MNVCSCCFSDEEIKQYIVNISAQKGTCSFCNNVGELIDIEEIIDFFEGFLSIYQFSENASESLYVKIQKDWSIFSSNLVAKNILIEVLSIINRHDININSKVEYCDEILECVKHWHNLKHDIKSNRRFITNIEKLESLSWDILFLNPQQFDSDHVFYRARIHETDNQNKYEKGEMGVPPKSKSRSGRANPLGIPFLYLSNEINTTLYESRALYLDNVSIGTFKIKEPNQLKIIDFTGGQFCFRSPFLFDDIITSVKSKFLMTEIGRDLSKPLRRHDSELEYIPTQFICEYLRYTYGVDGIMFKSSLHVDGINYVIFNHELMECVDVVQYQITSVIINANSIQAT